MPKNAYFLAKIGDDTPENEEHFAKILPIGRPRAKKTPWMLPNGGLAATAADATGWAMA